jgi:hypothetical protein
MEEIPLVVNASAATGSFTADSVTRASRRCVRTESAKACSQRAMATAYPSAVGWRDEVPVAGIGRHRAY